MEIITGYTGQPHVTAEQDRDINIGTFGAESYVLQTGTQLQAEVSSNNEVKIRDGVIMHQGCAASIKKNTYDSVTIMNGSQGMKRIDLIVARYEKNQETNVESITLKVLQGAPSENAPAIPAHNQGDIQAGDAIVDMPLYQVILEGLNITEVKKVFETMPGLAELNRKCIIESDSKYIKLPDGTLIQWGTGYFSTGLTSSAVKVPLQVAFVDENYNVQLTKSANGHTITNLVLANASGNSQKETDGFYVTGYMSTTSYTKYFDWLAIGRWK